MSKPDLKEALASLKIDRELRALLAVARAGNRLGNADRRYDEWDLAMESLMRALARLERVSKGKR